MKIEEALFELGVREDTLTENEKHMLDAEGYLPLRGVLSMHQVDALRKRQQELLDEEGDKAGLEVHQEAGTERLSDLINKGQEYSIVITHPRVLAGISHVLKGDLKLSSLNSRSALPGLGLQGLHADWGKLEEPGDYQVCNSVWLLDEFTADNGATRVVPRSHLEGKSPHEELSDPTAPHPDEIVLLGSPGDVVIFNAHLWHGGTLNRTDKPRRAMHGYFTRRHQPQQLDQNRTLRNTTREHLSEAALVVLGIEDSKK